MTLECLWATLLADLSIMVMIVLGFQVIMMMMAMLMMMVRMFMPMAMEVKMVMPVNLMKVIWKGKFFAMKISFADCVQISDLCKVQGERNNVTEMLRLAEI